MSIDLAKAGPSGCRGDDLGDPAAGEGAMRSLAPPEYRPARRACGPAVAQIRSHRFTDVRRQRETLGTVCFAADDDLAGPPLHIVVPKLGDFARSYAETDQHGQDRVITATVGSTAVTRRQKMPDLVRLQPLGQPNQTPAGDPRPTHNPHPA